MMAGAGKIAPHIIERILNHVTGRHGAQPHPARAGSTIDTYTWMKCVRHFSRWEAEGTKDDGYLTGPGSSLDAFIQPRQHFTLDPSNTTGPELDALGEAPAFSSQIAMWAGEYSTSARRSFFERIRIVWQIHRRPEDSNNIV